MKRCLPFLCLLLSLPAASQERTFHVEPSAADVGPTRATIGWSSTIECVGRVEYGVSEQLGSAKNEVEGTKSHKIVLEGLEPDTCYYYRVTAGDVSSAIEVFKTPPIRFHVAPYLQLPTSTSMTILWETNDLLDGMVEYGKTEALGQTVAENAGPMRLHQVTVSGLQPGTTYHYRVRSSKVVSAIHTFRTAPLPGAPKWRFAVYGDSRSNPAVHTRVVEQIAKANVDLILHTGDIVLDGRNHESWRREWFAPLAPVSATVPWVSTIGNHERDSANYFSYAALPGNERYFSFNYGNACIVCLDSNAWLEQGRDGLQHQWLEKTLHAPRDVTWTFVTFHHPLFSAHATRPITELRWQWAPLFLDPASRVDAVLNGHDHFYARNSPMARVRDGMARGVQFVTTAGGGASLYPLRDRDYLEQTRAVYHFLLMDCDGDRIQCSAIDLNGNVFDRFEMSKEPTPPERLAAFDVEETKEFLRKALATAPAIEVRVDKPTLMDGSLSVPTRFEVSIAGICRWERTPGWTFPKAEMPFHLQPGQPLQIDLKAQVEPFGVGTPPMLTIEFEPGRFRNRTIQLYPLKLVGPAQVKVADVHCNVDGHLDGDWMKVQRVPLVPTAVRSTRGTAPPAGASAALFGTDGQQLFFAASLASRSHVKPRDAIRTGSKVILSGEHVRLEVSDGAKTHVFALSNEQVPYHAINGVQEDGKWEYAAADAAEHWVAEMAIPLTAFADRRTLKVNVVYRHANGQEFELRPSFVRGQNPDVIPDWKASATTNHFARLAW